MMGMLTYNYLKDKVKEFLAATSLNIEEFLILLPAFAIAYQKLYPKEQRYDGKPRQRQMGGGDKARIETMEDKLLFILVYEKTNPLQTMHGLQFGLSQPQANYWIHRLLPVLKETLADLKLSPERDANQVAEHMSGKGEPPNTVVDATERRRQRPKDEMAQKTHYSGKKKAHTDKNIVLVNEHSGKVVYLGPTVEGKMHDKKAIETSEPTLPTNATLGQDTGFQGYAPANVITEQPKKSLEAKS